MAKLVFHVDVNSAYLSWEAARRVASGEPDIRLIPSVIGGDREKRTGVVLAKSIPAKKFGIKTGEPIGMALRKCPDLFMAKPDFLLYEENSKKFMDICREYAPVVEKASIDECYLDMSGTHRIYPDPVALAHTIKNRIRNEFGFTVNVGIGDNKLLAKMASDFEKPDKVHTYKLEQLHQAEAEKLRTKIEELETHIQSLDVELDMYRSINLVGVQVNEKHYGVGTIVSQNVNIIKVAFADGERSYIINKKYSMRPTFEDDVQIVEAMTDYELTLAERKTLETRLKCLK